MENRLGIGMIGYLFMGKAHTNAFKKLPYIFYPPPAIPLLRGICGRNQEMVEQAAKRFGYKYATTRWRDLIDDPEIQILDNNGPNNIHAEPCIAALEAGKHTLVEKPLALNLKEAKQMYRAAQKAQEKGIKNMVCFSNRFAPAILLAKGLIEEGKLGKIYHFRAHFLQDWLVDPDFPLAWRLRRKVAGSGVHGDLNAHSIDMARFLVGEITRVCGWTRTFIKERPIPISTTGLSGKGGKEKGEVDVDDASLLWLEFENGAMGSLEASRFSTGSKSVWRIEVHGTEGAVLFNLTRSNELQFYSREDPAYAQGFRTIIATEEEHPFIKYWWPPGHMLGWEHHHCNAIFHFVECVARDKEVSPYGATFLDGLRCQEVLEAGLISAERGEWVEIDEIRERDEKGKIGCPQIGQ